MRSPISLGGRRYQQPQEAPAPHIGKLILRILASKGVNVAELARRIRRK